MWLGRSCGAPEVAEAGREALEGRWVEVDLSTVWTMRTDPEVSDCQGVMINAIQHGT